MTRRALPALLLLTLATASPALPARDVGPTDVLVLTAHGTRAVWAQARGLYKPLPRPRWQVWRVTNGGCNGDPAVYEGAATELVVLPGETYLAVFTGRVETIKGRYRRTHWRRVSVRFVYSEHRVRILDG